MNARSIAQFLQLMTDHAAWSQKTFGSDEVRGPSGPLKHLLKEADEALNQLDDLEEYADCFLLILDATRRGGWTFDHLVDSAARKLEKNKLRKWPAASATEAVEHIQAKPKRQRKYVPTHQRLMRGQKL